MKARVIRTGEIVEVYKDVANMVSQYIPVYTIVDRTRHFDHDELDFNFKNSINENKELFNVARDNLIALLSNEKMTNEHNLDELISISIDIANKFISKFKNESK